jgi:hypothetical protein
MQYINRQEKGQLIAQADGSVKRINEKEYFVNSQSNGSTYRVQPTTSVRGKDSDLMSF